MMLEAVALALLGAPFMTVPGPQYGGDPALVALASRPGGLRLHCYSTRCGDEEWRRELTLPPLPAKRAAGLPILPGAKPRAPLAAGATARTTRAGYSNPFRVGGRVGVQAVREPDTRLGVQVGAGYRLAPLHDDGIADTGPVLRGEVDFGRRLGERAHWTQRVQVEAGRDGDTFVKQSFGLEVEVWPAWLLETDYVIRHGSHIDDSSRHAEGWLGLRRWF